MKHYDRFFTWTNKQEEKIEYPLKLIGLLQMSSGYLVMKMLKFHICQKGTMITVPTFCICTLSLEGRKILLGFLTYGCKLPDLLKLFRLRGIFLLGHV